MKRLLLSGCDSIILLMVATSCLVTDRLRYVMIVSIPDTITHQELERKLILKNTYGQVLNHKLKAIIARERVRFSEAIPSFDIRYSLFDILRFAVHPDCRLPKAD
jgi:hypothetical protein